jgi:hypothetical protein
MPKYFSKTIPKVNIDPLKSKTGKELGKQQKSRSKGKIWGRRETDFIFGRKKEHLIVRRFPSNARSSL